MARVAGPAFLHVTGIVNRKTESRKAASEPNLLFTIHAFEGDYPPARILRVVLKRRLCAYWRIKLLFTRAGRCGKIALEYPAQRHSSTPVLSLRGVQYFITPLEQGSRSDREEPGEPVPAKSDPA